MKIISIIVIQLSFLVFSHINCVKAIELNRKVLESIYGFTLNYATSLNLCCRKFSHITDDTFLDLKNIQNLILASNVLTYLDSTMFPSSLSKLVVLELYSNELTLIDAFTFRQLVNLKTLRLYNNKITSIDRSIFFGLFNLETVYMRTNPISEILPSYVKRLCSTNPKCTIYL